MIPGEIEGLPLKLTDQFKELEERTMTDIVRRLKNNGNDIIRSADWQIHRLYELGKGEEEIKSYIAEALNLSLEEIDDIYEKALNSGFAYDESIYEQAGAEIIPYSENENFKQLVLGLKKQTSEELVNITQSMGFAVRQTDGTLKFLKTADYYQKTLDGAMLDISSGLFDYNTVLKRVVAEMTNSGLRTVSYASGWTNRIDVAARRAVMTGISQLTGKINESNAQAFGTDTFEVSWHSGARPEHLEWQGGWYTKEQLVSVCGLGSVTGLCGANCYHSYSPVIPGISKPTYTEEQLREMKKQELTPLKYGNREYTKYEALQRQRKLETLMRAQRLKIKLLKEGGAREDDIIAARSKYRGISQEYTRFARAMNLPEQRERVYIGDSGGISGMKSDPHRSQYERYKARLGDDAPGSYEDFIKLKSSNSSEWTDLQLKYRYKGIDDRLLQKNSSYTVLDIKDGVPDEYSDSLKLLNDKEKTVIYTYTDGAEGCKEINIYAATGKEIAPDAKNKSDILHDALSKMSLPRDTVVFRGTSRKYIEGLCDIEKKFTIKDWKGKKVYTKAFSSTSLFRDTSYEGEVEMTIIVPKNKKGAGYVNDISHHKINNIGEEYEIILQKNSKYAIIEAQYFNKKLFLVLEWLGELTL